MLQLLLVSSLLSQLTTTSGLDLKATGVLNSDKNFPTISIFPETFSSVGTEPFSGSVQSTVLARLFHCGGHHRMTLEHIA